MKIVENTKLVEEMKEKHAATLKEYESKLTEMTTEKENFVIKLNSIEDQVHSIQEEKEQLMTKNQEASEKLALVAQEKNDLDAKKDEELKILSEEVDELKKNLKEKEAAGGGIGGRGREGRFFLVQTNARLPPALWKSASRQPSVAGKDLFEYDANGLAADLRLSVSDARKIIAARDAYLTAP